METLQAIAALAALAQETRLAIFRLLVQAGPEGLTASKIAERLDLAPSLLSFHVKELLQAGLLVQKRAGRFVVYSAHFDAMNGLLGFLTDNCCGGNPCSPVSTAACGAKPC